MKVKEIKELLKQKGLRQKDVAELTGYSKEYVSRVLNEKVDLSLEFENKIKEITGLKESSLTDQDLKTELERMLAEMRAQTEVYKQMNDQLLKEIEKKDATIDRLLGLLEKKEEK